MTFSQSISTVFSKYATFTGRASRSEYWYFCLFNVLVAFVLNCLGAIFSGNDGQPSMVFTGLAGLYSLAVIIPGLAVSVRRMHDIGKGGGWIFVSLIPLVGWIWFIVLAATPSEPGDNRFGPMPE